LKETDVRESSLQDPRHGGPYATGPTQRFTTKGVPLK
jgi:hypothetical protein